MTTLMHSVDDRKNIAVPDRAPALSVACRFCGEKADHLFVDLGMSPLCESILTAEQLNDMEPFYPLRVHVCPRCFLVQLSEYVSPEHIFSEYAYFSSYSTSWVGTLALCKGFSAPAVDRHGLRPELASNDGYLLQHFVDAGIHVLGERHQCCRGGSTEACRRAPALRDRHRTKCCPGEQADLLIGK